MKKKLKFLFYSIFILLGIIGFIGIHFIGPYGMLQPSRSNASTKPFELGLKGDELSIASDKNALLKGYRIHSKTSKTRGVIILIHGIGGCKEHFLGLAEQLAKQGVSSMVFDGRAHGESGGKYCTYGYHEKKDISKIVDEIKSKTPDLPIGIWGNSLGGAVAIQALEHDERIDFGIIESTFTDLSQIVYDYKKRILKGIGIRWVSDYALRRAGKIADFDPAKVKPLESVKHIEQPVLIAHGDADKNIAHSYGQQLFDHLKSSDKEFVSIKGGQHFGLMAKGGKSYQEKLKNFINSNLEVE